MEDLGNILQHDDDELSQEQLKKYLSGDADADGIHAIEKNMADNAFINDAVEGLQEFSSQDKMDSYVTDLNKKLQQQLEGTRQRKEKRRIKDLSWVILAVIIILLLCIAGFWIIKMQREKQEQKNNIKEQVYSKQVSRKDEFIL